MRKPASSKPSVRIETWTRGQSDPKTAKVITKVAVRWPNGQFHGSTNLPMKVGDTVEYR